VIKGKGVSVVCMYVVNELRSHQYRLMTEEREYYLVA